jgi:hypothetical protein
VIVQADRLVAANWQQIAAMQGKGEVKAWEVALHQQALGLYDRLMQDLAFRQLDVFAKADAMKTYAKDLFNGEHNGEAATAGAVPVLRPVRDMAASIVRETEEDDDDDQEMIDGVIDILRGITDEENRRRSAEERIADFTAQGIAIDREAFMQRVMGMAVDMATAPAQDVAVANTALNGAQVQSLVQIINQVSLGLISRETAKPLIVAAFPGIDQTIIDQMLAGVKTLSAEQAQQL